MLLPVQAKAANVSVSDVASVLSTTAGTPPPVGGPAALAAANKVYGASSAALANVSGHFLYSQHLLNRVQGYCSLVLHARPS